MLDRTKALSLSCCCALAVLVMALLAIAFSPLRALAAQGDFAAGDIEEISPQGTVHTEDSTVAMNRLYNPNSGEHFYTADNAERDYLASLGWQYEGAGWVAPKTSSTPVHRLYNPVAGEHHYTMDEGEKNNLVSVGWNYEGIGWYSADAGSTRVGLYRQYNPNAFACNHNFTTNGEEHTWLVGLGWRAEGLSWYGLASTSGATGWFQVNGAWRYYSNGSPAKGWLVVGTPPPIAAIGGGLQRYWLTSDYSLAVNRVVDPSNAADAGCGYRAFATGGGYVSRNSFLTIGGSWHRTNDDGLLSVDTVTNRLVMLSAAYSSPTNFLIMVDVDDPRTVVFEGSQGHWNVRYVWDCCTGAPSSPTVTGVYHVGIKGYSFGEGHGYSCYYYTQFYGNYLFHTRKYYAYTWNLMDGRMGVRCSEGCVRLYDDAAIWIYHNIPHGTTVVTTT